MHLEQKNLQISKLSSNYSKKLKLKKMQLAINPTAKYYHLS